MLKDAFGITNNDLSYTSSLGLRAKHFQNTLIYERNITV